MSTDTTQTLQVGFPVGKSRLEAMPDELLEMVTKFLAPKDALQHLDPPTRTGYRKGISDLLDLCLVSKRLEVVVRPVIFGTVMICRSIQLVRLFRTLTENPVLGENIKKLEFYTQFSRQEPDHEFLDLGILRGLDPDIDSTLPQGSARISGRQENEIRSNVYVKVLEKAPNVKQVTINPPTWSVRGINDAALAAFGVASAVAHKQAAMPQPSLRRLPESLEALILEGDPFQRGIKEGLPKQISRMLSQDQADGSKLVRMAWFSDDTTWFSGLPGQEWNSAGLRGQLTSLTTLILDYSSCRFSDIAIVCDSFPYLKSLKIISDYPRFYLGDGKTDVMDGLCPDATRLCLTRSITKLQQLESLHLDLATVPVNRKLLGPDGGLDLSSLPKLQDVMLSFRLVVFNKIQTPASSRYDPSRVLPQSLARLYILVHGYRCEAGSGLMEFLGGLLTASKYGFPRLREVEYAYATGTRGQVVDPGRICVCAASKGHEDYCTCDRNSRLPCAFRPRVPAEKYQDLVGKFGQRGIKLTMREVWGYVVVGASYAPNP